MTNSTPLTVVLFAPSMAAFSTFHSGSKAEITATRGVGSSRSAACSGVAARADKHAQEGKKESHDSG